MPIAFRFLVAGFILLACAKLTGQRISPNRQVWSLIVILGLGLFVGQYVCLYWGSTGLTPTLVSLGFAMIAIFNLPIGWVALGERPGSVSLLAAFLGVGGLVLILLPRTMAGLSGDFGLSIIPFMAICILGAFIVSLSGLVQIRLDRLSISVLPSTAYAMLVGSSVLAILALARGESISPTTLPPAWWGSLLVLSVFGSALSFVGYLKLVTLAGPSLAGFTLLFSPVFALIIGSFTGSEPSWTLVQFGGLAVLTAGNAMILLAARPITDPKVQTEKVDSEDSSVPGPQEGAEANRSALRNENGAPCHGSDIESHPVVASA